MPNSHTPNFSSIDPEVLKKARGFLEQAKEDAIARSSKTPGAIERITNALENRLFPKMLEGEVIANQLEDPEYQQYAEETREYLDALVGFVACPDGRIVALALADPLVGKFHRKLQGLPEVRPSTTNPNKHVLNDPHIAAYIRYYLVNRKKKNKNPEIVEFMGPHINSFDPSHGCGAATAKVVAQGQTPEYGMRFGAIKEYFKELGDGFHAVDYITKVVGGKSTTFDLIHGAYSQEILVGLRNEYENFDESLSLRENLEKLAHEKKIIMSGLLDEIFRENILKEAKQMGVSHPLHVNEYTHFAKNGMIIGKIARAITKHEEKNEYSFIPNVLKKDKSEVAVRVLAYHIIRNCTYRILGNIHPGKHLLIKHPEQLIRIGPIGADYNIKNIPFIESVPAGSFRDEDLARVSGLYNLSYNVLKEQGVDLSKEGRIIIVTGRYDPQKYATEDFANLEYKEVSQMVLNNSAMIRLQYKESILSGEAIVIGALYKPGSRRLTHIV